MPWKILASTQGYIFTWLVGYSALLGPVAGIMLVDYYFLRDTRLDTAALFAERGEYAYRNGWNPAARDRAGARRAAEPAGLSECGVSRMRSPMSRPLFKTIYTYAWFVGLAISALVYAVLMRRAAPHAALATR